ncbi:HEAT repeat domain-containing protein [bacterium]|nr:HEAT repeat domain-containing protein [bacterium]
MEVSAPVKRPSPITLSLPILLTLTLAAGCTNPPPPPPPPAPVLDPKVSQRIDEALDLLNNNNIEERWRNQLVDCAQSGDLARSAAIERTIAKVKKSYEPGAAGPGYLKPVGRRRAFEALDKFGGEDGQVMEVLQQGAKESNAEVRCAAGAALANRGDEGAIPALLSAVKEAKDDATTVDHGVKALERFAKPERRDQFLGALALENRKAMTGVTLACFPPEGPERTAALRAVAKNDANPFARMFALEQLALAKDHEVVDLARAALDAGSPPLRTRALTILLDQGGEVAAKEVGAALEKDPPDADAVALVLVRCESPRAVEIAVSVLDDAGKKPGTRAAAARSVLGRLKLPETSASLRADAPRELALTALRRAINDPSDEVGRAACDALGAMGDESDAEALVILLSKPGTDRGDAAVRALGRIGGAVAVEKLVDTHATNAKLRPACKEALSGMKNLDLLPFDQGMLLIRQLSSDELDLRKSAVSVLHAMRGGSDVEDFDPSGEKAARERSVDRWRAWWKKKKSGG